MDAHVSSLHLHLVHRRSCLQRFTTLTTVLCFGCTLKGLDEPWATCYAPEYGVGLRVHVRRTDAEHRLAAQSLSCGPAERRRNRL